MNSGHASSAELCGPGQGDLVADLPQHVDAEELGSRLVANDSVGSGNGQCGP
jgi:hypothetical protein